MMPILLVSNNAEESEQFIDNLIKHYKIPLSHVIRIRIESDKKTKQTISIDQIREIPSMLSRSSEEKMFIVIYDFDTAKQEAQNAFLKTLEEKNTQAQFCLVVQNEMMIIPTIMSRTIVKNIATRRKKPVKEDFIFNTCSNLSEAMKQTANLPKDQLLVVMDNMIRFLQNFLKEERHDKKILTELLREAVETRRYMVENNMSGEHSLDHILIRCYQKGIWGETRSS